MTAPRSGPCTSRPAWSPAFKLITAAVVWTYCAYVLTDGVLTAEQTAAVVSLSGGALFANVVSVVLLVVETVSFQRR